MYQINKLLFASMLLQTLVLQQRQAAALHTRQPGIAAAATTLAFVQFTTHKSQYKRRCQRCQYFSSSTSTSTYMKAKDDIHSYSKSDIPLVFVPGMKGTHLSFYVQKEEEEKKRSAKMKKVLLDKLKPYSSSLKNNSNKERKKKRAWLTLRGLFNVPPLVDDHPRRSIALPLTYTNGVQDKGHLFPDGIIEHVIDLGLVEFFPFYGHVTKHLETINDLYQQHVSSLSSSSSSSSLGNQEEEETNPNPNVNVNANECRPTAIFPYDWRRPVSELSTELHNFCESEFPNQPVQIVAHSLGGLITFDAMRKHPQKYQPGGVIVGVPFGTGIQYFQDLHRGYYTELNRCRQFTPKDQFTCSSHWIFFPIDEEGVGDRFVDVSDETGDDIPVFQPDKSSIGKQVDDDECFKPNAINGKNIKVNFQNVHEWEELEIGIFDPTHRKTIDEKTKEAYVNHMKIQLREAKEWRENVLLKDLPDKDAFPNLVVAATNAIPTVNQILRRRRDNENEGNDKDNDNDKDNYINDDHGNTTNCCSWEYDYISGRSVPGDGRIDYDKAFPEIDVNMKTISLSSLHAKQMCWEESGGSWGTIWNEVREQLQQYEGKNACVNTKQNEKEKETTMQF